MLVWLAQPTVTAVFVSTISGGVHAPPLVGGDRKAAAAGATPVTAPEASTVHALPEPSFATSMYAPTACSSTNQVAGRVRVAMTEPSNLINTTVEGPFECQSRPTSTGLPTIGAGVTALDGAGVAPDPVIDGEPQALTSSRKANAEANRNVNMVPSPGKLCRSSRSFELAAISLNGFQAKWLPDAILPEAPARAELLGAGARGFRLRSDGGHCGRGLRALRESPRLPDGVRGQQHPESDGRQTGGEYRVADNADEGVWETDRAAHDVDHHADRYGGTSPAVAEPGTPYSDSEDDEAHREQFVAQNQRQAGGILHGLVEKGSHRLAVDARTRHRPQHELQPTQRQMCKTHAGQGQDRRYMAEHDSAPPCHVQEGEDRGYEQDGGSDAEVDVGQHHVVIAGGHIELRGAVAVACRIGDLGDGEEDRREDEA